MRHTRLMFESVSDPAPEPTVTVVGVGAGGWADLAESSRSALRTAEVIIGSERQLALLDDIDPARHVLLPSPLHPGLDDLLATHRGRRVAVLASGDPLFFGIGATLVRRLGRDAVRVLPHPSSVSLAAARLGWPLHDLDVVSVVGRPLALLHPFVQPRRRILVLTATAAGAREVRTLLAGRGYARSEVTVLAQLGGPAEHVGPGTDEEHDPLAVVAIECVADADTMPLSRSAVLSDDAFEHDGQITKREIRALTLAVLVPVPGQLLWDIGAGSGSIGIEWLRTHPACRALAIEPRADRRARIAANAEALGVPGLQIIDGKAPPALDALPAPDAVFIGGGASVAGVIEACHAALRPGGRLVANAVTIETETALASWHTRLGGTLTRIMVQRAAPVGGFTGWRPALPVTQWTWRKDGM